MPHLEACLLDLEDFLWVDASSPNLMALPLRMAVAHVRFEAIHPFSDGNGHVGRLLPPLMMAVESLPPLYLAGYLKTHQRECYDGLAGVQLRGRWIDWLGFFLDGIAAAAATAQSLLDVRRNWQGRTAHLRTDAAARRLPDMLLGAPVQTVASAREATGRRWGRSFQAHEVRAVLEGRAEPKPPDGMLTPTKVAGEGRAPRRH